MTGCIFAIGASSLACAEAVAQGGLGMCCTIASGV